MEFTPPIAQQATDELVRIANYPNKWNPVAVEQAKQALLFRNVSVDYQQKKTKIWNQFYKRKKEATSQSRGEVSYSWLEVILDLPEFLVGVVFDWNLKKDGYTRKHKQRKYILSALVVFIVVLYV